jgi:FtsP/CotA-like multicopper oxidase with cupredoxin domain
MLNDWTHELSDVIYARYEKTGSFPFCVDSILANGHGRVQCLPDSILQAGTDLMGAGMSDMSNASNMSNMPALTPLGCTPPMMFKGGYDISDLPQETCTNTTSDPLKISANETRGWMALNLVNAGAVSALSVSLDGHSMVIYDADGRYVDLQETQVRVPHHCLVPFVNLE